MTHLNSVKKSAWTAIQLRKSHKGCVAVLLNCLVNEKIDELSETLMLRFKRNIDELAVLAEYVKQCNRSKTKPDFIGLIDRLHLNVPWKYKRIVDKHIKKDFWPSQVDRSGDWILLNLSRLWNTFCRFRPNSASSDRTGQILCRRKLKVNFGHFLIVFGSELAVNGGKINWTG